MGRDPLMIWGARSDTLYGLVSTMDKAADDVGKARLPTLYLYGAHDQIIPKNAAFKAAAQLKPDRPLGLLRPRLAPDDARPAGADGLEGHPELHPRSRRAAAVRRAADPHRARRHATMRRRVRCRRRPAPDRGCSATGPA